MGMPLFIPDYKFFTMGMSLIIPNYKLSDMLQYGGHKLSHILRNVWNCHAGKDRNAGFCDFIGCLFAHGAVYDGFYWLMF